VTGRTAQAEALRAARQRDSLTKRGRVRQVLDELERLGEPITFASVARHAQVSTWLVYAPGIREHIDAARTRHHRRPATEQRAAAQSGLVPSAMSLRTDLELARAEITTLRTERDLLNLALRRRLGQDLDTLSTAELSTRVAELTRHNQQLTEHNHSLTSDNTALHAKVVELENDLGAVRTSLRRMIREQNTPD
jgi:chromosome segregation ATPase